MIGDSAEPGSTTEGCQQIEETVCLVLKQNAKEWEGAPTENVDLKCHKELLECLANILNVIKKQATEDAPIQQGMQTAVKRYLAQNRDTSCGVNLANKVNNKYDSPQAKNQVLPLLPLQTAM